MKKTILILMVLASIQAFGQLPSTIPMPSYEITFVGCVPWAEFEAPAFTGYICQMKMDGVPLDIHPVNGHFIFLLDNSNGHILAAEYRHGITNVIVANYQFYFSEKLNDYKLTVNEGLGSSNKVAIYISGGKPPYSINNMRYTPGMVVPIGYTVTDQSGCTIGNSTKESKPVRK